MQISMFLSEELPANPSQSQDSEKDWQTRVATSCWGSVRLLNAYAPSGWFGRTSPASCRVTEDGILAPSSGCWANSGMGSPTEFLTLSISEWHSDAAVCSLSDTLETGDVPQRFFLSATACQGILRRAEKRGKQLPPSLRAALQAVAFTQNQRDEVRTLHVAGALAAEPGAKQQTYLVHCVDMGGNKGLNGGGISEELTPPLSTNEAHAVAFTASEQANSYAWEREYAPTLNAQAPNDTSNIQTGVRIGMQVRRLTPTECERLQGFPDDFTAIPYRGKPASQCPDGPRYKALGNSMAVPVMAWIGKRIAAVQTIKD